MATKPEQPVLVVGAGPSGLMMAYMLGRFNIPCLIIDKDEIKSPFSRAVAVQIRTLEIFSALGLYEKLAEKSQSVSDLEVFAENRKPVTIHLHKTTSFFERLLVIDQPHTELVLEQALASMGTSIMRGCELIDFCQHDQGITAVLQDANGHIESKQFSYIIGADGAHSRVRKQMAEPFLGSTYDDAFILADAEVEYPLDHHTFRIFFKNKRFLALIPMQGKNHYRLISVRRGETKKIGPPPTIEEFRDLAQKVIPFAVEIKNPVWVSRFFVQCRSASHYQEGRAFLVGDAAHIHSPAGGQGMNTGLQDAFNLAWKLAMVIKGLARPTLLATYHPERKPVGDFLIDRTDRLFKFMVKSSIWARLLRRFVLPRVARSKDLTLKLITIGSQTAIRYQEGAICNAHRHLSIPNIRIGVRIPNLKLITNHFVKTDLHTIITDLYFSVLLFLPPNILNANIQSVLDKKAIIEKKWPHSLRVYLIFCHGEDVEKTMSNKFDYLINADDSSNIVSQTPYFVAVRPDHHVYCVGSLADIEQLTISLNTYLF